MIDELNAMTNAHGYKWGENESGTVLYFWGQGYKFQATAEAGEDGVEMVRLPHEQDEYPPVIDSLLGLAVEILEDRFLPPTH